MKNTILFFLFTLLTQSLRAEVPVTIVAPKDVINDYNLFLNGKSPLEVSDFKGKQSRRDVVELVLVQQALSKGGYKGEIKIIEAPSYARINEIIKNGKADISGTSDWKEDIILEKQIASEIIIKQGQFEAGFYTATNNTKALSAKSVNDIRQLTAISNRDWKPDWNTLSALKIKHLEHVVLWESIVKMVNKKRGDFTLAPFQQTEDMSLEMDGVKLIPIPGIKISLAGNRAYLVSKKGIWGEKILPILNKGIKILQMKNIITTAYSESRFFNP